MTRPQRSVADVLVARRIWDFHCIGEELSTGPRRIGLR